MRTDSRHRTAAHRASSQRTPQDSPAHSDTPWPHVRASSPPTTLQTLREHTDAMLPTNIIASPGILLVSSATCSDHMHAPPLSPVWATRTGMAVIAEYARKRLMHRWLAGGVLGDEGLAASRPPLPARALRAVCARACDSATCCSGWRRVSPLARLKGLRRALPQ